jgi:uncharacterized membrane protein YvbJ
MEINKIYNEDALITMKNLDFKVDAIITSPPYNTGSRIEYWSNKIVNGVRVYKQDKRYDKYIDSKTNEEYIDWTVNLFNGYNNIGIGSSGSTVHIDGDGLTMKEGADIKIGGKSLTKAIEKIEERLGILHPNPKLEERWEQLKELRRQYVEMEKDLLEKEKLMKILKEA